MKNISSFIALLLVAVFFLNINSLLNYEEDIIFNTAEVEVIEDGLKEELPTDKYNGLKSIKDVEISGNLDLASLSFAKPQIEKEGGKPLTDEDNKKIFFFGRIDESDYDSSWNEWEESTTPTTPTNNNIQTKEPIEVNLDKFLENYEK